MEHKFRVWGKFEKRWIENAILTCEGELYTINKSGGSLILMNIDNYIIQFATDGKDSKGKIAFDGDIVAYHYIPESDYESSVWLSGTVSFSGSKYMISGHELDDDLIDLIDDVEIVGNICENKELLNIRDINDKMNELNY